MEAREVQPLVGWLLVKAVKPAEATRGGLLLARDMDKDVRSEGMAEIVQINPLMYVRKGSHIKVAHGLHVGERILYRGFLRFAQPCGEFLGADSKEFFLLHILDVLAVVEGEGTAGFYGEFQT